MLLETETLAKYGYETLSLGKSSNKYVIVKCDYCGIKLEKRYGKYNLQRVTIQKDCCMKVVCSQQKIKEVNLAKYGDTSGARAPQAVAKRKKTCLAKYGVEYPLQSSVTQDKAKATRKERYGKENPFEVEIFKEKIKNKLRKHNGKTLTEWAATTDLSYSTFVELKNDYGLEFALSHTKKTSSLEQVVHNWLVEANIKHESNITLGKFRPDFILPNNTVVEIDGLFWHQEKEVPGQDYHKRKRDEYLRLGYTPLFFREDELNNKFEIMKSIILNKLGKSTRIFARKCKIVKLTMTEANEFFENTHLMNKGKGRCVGLSYNDEIVCAMRFVNKKDKLEISRFSTKLFTNVIGGYSRLIKYIEDEFRPNIIENFVDLRYGSGDHLLKLGFEKISENLSFQWTNFKETFHRMKFPGKTGYEYNLVKIWDCGQAKFIKRKSPTT